jgi:hypothetical protein
MTFEVTVTQDDNVTVTMPQVDVVYEDQIIVVQQDDLGPSIVVTLDEETEVIQTFDQGPPGIAGPQGTPGKPGEPGVDGIPQEAPIDGKTYGRLNAQWSDIAFAAATVQVLDTPPAGAADGSLWYDSDTGLLYILYNDGNSKQWVIVPREVSLTDAPIDDSFYGRRNSAWQPVAPLLSPIFTGVPATTNPSPGDHSTRIATTAFVVDTIALGSAAGSAPINSPIFTGDPRAPTPPVGDNDSSIANTSFVTTAIAGKEDKALKGALYGYASLDGNGMVPSAQLPAYVDDVVEYANLAAFPATGTSGVIYVAIDTNKTYRWSGTSYIEMTSSPGTTDDVPEGTVNLYYTDARASDAAPVQSVSGKTGVVTLSRSDVGLNNVDNTSDADKSVSTATQAALDLKAPLASPALTGIPTAPTAAPGISNNQIASTAFVTAMIATGGNYVEAPQDGGYYGRMNAAWAPVASLASPIFTGDPRAPTPSPGDADSSIATTGFVAAAIASSAAGVTISDTPPVGAPDNSLWWESDSGLLYVRYNDGDTTQWVGGSPGPMGPQGPPGLPGSAGIASSVSVTPVGNIASTNVQAALAEVDSEKVAKAGDIMTGTLTAPTISATQYNIGSTVFASISGNFTELKSGAAGDATGSNTVAIGKNAAAGNFYSADTHGFWNTGFVTQLMTLSATGLSVVGALNVGGTSNFTGNVGIGFATPSPNPLRVKVGTNQNMCAVTTGTWADIAFVNDAGNGYVEGGIDANPLHLNANAGGPVTVSGQLGVGGNVNPLGPSRLINMVGSDIYFSYSTPSNGAEVWLLGKENAAPNSRFIIFNAQNSSYPITIDAVSNIIAGAGAYKPGGGPWTDSSDVRIKNVLGDYEAGLDAILALHPVRFTFKGNDTHEPASDTLRANPSKKTKTSTPTVPYLNSPHYLAATEAQQFIGLIAQAAETVMPELVSHRDGYIDGKAVTDLRDIDTTPLVFALINAVKELSAQVNELRRVVDARP